MTDVKRLGSYLADQAMNGANDYLRSRNVTPDLALLDLLIPKIREHCRATLKQALEDGRAAYEANMSNYAGLTVAASFRLAGIEAAKETIASLKV
jgi:hypothetical protein